ncbi:acidPPc domain-containing protein, partial [Durusdinium trenchii]
NIGNVWEGDYSFPSGHAQSLSGVLLCSFFTFKLPIVWLPVMLLFGAFIAVSRNYLGVHWCSDTFTGWAIGSFTGILWGVLDPYDALLRREDPFLSLAVGMCFALGLIALSAFSLAVTTPVEPELRAEWLDTAVRGLEAFKCSQVVPEDEMDEARGRMILRCGASSRPRRLRSRHLVYAAGPAIGGGVCLALTGAYPELPPHVFHCLELRAPLHVAILRVLVGSTGVALLLLALACPLYVVRNAPLEGRTGAMKVALLLLPLTLAPVWVFFLSQLVME